MFCVMRKTNRYLGPRLPVCGGFGGYEGCYLLRGLAEGGSAGPLMCVC